MIYLYLGGTAALIGLTISWGWWAATLLAGALLAVMPRMRKQIRFSFLAGAIGWGIPLVVQSFSGEIGKLAKLLGGILGMGGAEAYAVLCLPSLIGGLLALSGAWVSCALQEVLPALAVGRSVEPPVQD